MGTTVNPLPDRTGGGAAEIATLTVTLMRQSAGVAGGIARAAGLSETDGAALRALDVLAAGNLSAGALAERLALSNAATTGLLDRLERAGLATRASDPHDRRRVVVGLTTHAQTIGEEYLAPLRRQVEDATATLEPDQFGAVREFLAAVLAAMPSGPGAADGPTP